VYLRSLRPLGYHFRRQRPHGRYILDFVCLKHHLVIEIDGSQHALPMRSRRDVSRDGELRSDGLRVLRFWNNEVDSNVDVVFDTILASLR
jgi:very-short-patch-repair endonuclease